MEGSGAALATPTNAASGAIHPTLRIGGESIDRGDEALDLREIRRELAAQRASIDAAAARPLIEQASHGGERPEDRLSGGQHRVIGERSLAAAQAAEGSGGDEEDVAG